VLTGFQDSSTPNRGQNGVEMDLDSFSKKTGGAFENFMRAIDLLFIFTIESFA